MIISKINKNIKKKKGEKEAPSIESSKLLHQTQQHHKDYTVKENQLNPKKSQPNKSN
jgi:hypothetical protein